MSAVKFPGKEVELGGVKYTLAPLSLRQVRELQPQLKKVSTRVSAAGDEDDTRFDAVIKVIHASISRNHPDVTEDQLADMLDMGNLGTVVEAAMNISGMVRITEKLAAGGAANEVPLTGMSSTQTSSPASQDGLGNTSTTT